MKFVHIADMHFDSPFVNLSDKGIMGDLRRLEQRKVFKKIIEFIKENYEAEHTLSFDTVLEDLGILCRRNGGKL